MTRYISTDVLLNNTLSLGGVKPSVSSVAKKWPDFLRKTFYCVGKKCSRQTPKDSFNSDGFFFSPELLVSLSKDENSKKKVCEVMRRKICDLWGSFAFSPLVRHFHYTTFAKSSLLVL